MKAKELHSVTLKVVERMKTGKLPDVMSHQDLVEIIKQEAPGVDGRSAWNALSNIIRLLVSDCRRKLLWRNCFSLKGVHGKGSKRQLEYHREVCINCQERVACLEEAPTTILYL